MDSWPDIPCFLCNQLIAIKESEHYDYLGKIFCVSCFESISGGNYSKAPPIRQEIECTVPKALNLSNNSSETCNTHQKSYKYFCELCKVSLCIYCLENHSQHGFSDLTVKANDLISNLRTVEYLARYSLNFFDEKASDLSEIIENILEVHQKAVSKTKSSVISYLSSEISIWYKKLQSINRDLLGLSVVEAEKMTEQGRDLLKEPKNRSYMHWCEWNDCCLHLVDLESMVHSSLKLPNRQVFPLFCRSVSLPHKQILVCGGRKEATTPGLASAFLVYIEENCRIEAIDNMHTGRSNHFILCFKEHAYVIGGCDSSNQFTNKCERLRIATLKWEQISSCNQIRDTCAAVGIEEQNCIYVLGGRLSNNELSQTAEKFEIFNNCWITLKFRLPNLSSVHGAALISSSEILIFAGQDRESKPLKKAFILNFQNGTSQETNELASKGGCIVNEIVVFREKVYALLFQGFTSKSLESWDILTHTWKVESD